MESPLTVGGVWGRTARILVGGLCRRFQSKGARLFASSPALAARCAGLVGNAQGMDAGISIQRVGSARKSWARVVISAVLNLRWLVVPVLAMGRAKATLGAGRGTLPITGVVVVRVGLGSDLLLLHLIAPRVGVVRGWRVVGMLFMFHQLAPPQTKDKKEK